MYMYTLHIEEGICLPVNVRLGLTRNVTIRHTRDSLEGLISTYQCFF